MRYYRYIDTRTPIDLSIDLSTIKSFRIAEGYMQHVVTAVTLPPSAAVSVQDGSFTNNPVRPFYTTMVVTPTGLTFIPVTVYLNKETRMFELSLPSSAQLTLIIEMDLDDGRDVTQLPISEIVSHILAAGAELPRVQALLVEQLELRTPTKSLGFVNGPRVRWKMRDPDDVGVITISASPYTGKLPQEDLLDEVFIRTPEKSRQLQKMVPPSIPKDTEKS